MLTNQEFGVPSRNERQEQNGVGRWFDMKGTAREENNGRCRMLTDSSNDFFVSVIGNQTAAYQKKVNEVLICAGKQCFERVLLNLIRVEQDSKRLLTDFSTTA